MDLRKKEETGWLRTSFRILLGVFLAYAGTGHLFWLREEFYAQVPSWVPMSKDLVVVLSGFVEIALGLSLIFLKNFNVWVGWIVAIFFVAVFPGNIAQYVNHVNSFGLDTDTQRLVRLFFQPVLIAWALWSTGAYRAYKNNNK